METDLNNDLQVSESESENEGQPEAGEDSNEGFDIEEFLQWSVWSVNLDGYVTVSEHISGLQWI